MTTKQAAPATPQFEAFPFLVTFSCYAPTLRKRFENVEFHRSEADYRLRAAALGWTVKKVERSSACSFRCA